jgi:hypothetical protein
MLAALAAAGTVANGADAKPTSLQRYLSSMSWPVRASVLRARSVSQAIDGWIGHGDPPFLGQIAGRCRNLLAVESRGRLLKVSAPPSLRTSHARLVRAYRATRDGCARVRLTALATRTAIEHEDRNVSDRATTEARTSLLRFERTALTSFSRAVTAWRSAVLRESRASGLPLPKWLGELP